MEIAATNHRCRWGGMVEKRDMEIAATSHRCRWGGMAEKREIDITAASAYSVYLPTLLPLWIQSFPDGVTGLSKPDGWPR